MAGDWIKMRVWLSRDPRVISMADYLAVDRGFMDWLTDPVRQSCKVTAHEHVTRNVTVALCVTGLLVTWGTAREQGDRENDDLVLHHADLNTLDAMTDMPGFGQAMSMVGWAIEGGEMALRFPKFFKENESPDDRHRRQAAERQARYREKQSRSGDGPSDVTDDVTVTHREEKRREEKKLKDASPPAPPDGPRGTSKAKRPPTELVVTLPDWLPPETWAAFVEMRRKIHKPIATVHAAELLLRTLTKYRDDGHDPLEVVNNSIASSYQGLFPPSRANGSGHSDTTPAWLDFRNSIRDQRPSGDPAVSSVVSSLGGLHRLGEKATFDLDRMRAEFDRAYRKHVVAAH